MAVTGSVRWYGKAFANMLGGETAGESIAIDWLSDDIKVMLCDSNYNPDYDAHEFRSDVTNEVTGSAGYTARGAALGTKTVTYVTGTHLMKLDAGDVTWSTATITARRAVIYKDSGTDNSSPLLGCLDFGQNVASTSGDFVITWDTNGIFNVTVTI